MKSIEERVLGRNASWALSWYYSAPAHPMKLRIWTLLRRFLEYRRLTVPYFEKGWITVDERDYLQEMVLRTGRYEPEVWYSLAEVAKSDEIVWDIGANIGSFTICALLDSRIRKVHAFEPDPLHAEVLSYNVALNKGSCQLHQCALSDEIGRRSLLHATFPHVGGSTFMSNPAHGRFEGHFQVDCGTVDHLVYCQSVEIPTLMKIDVEGWEQQVLKGATRLLSTNPPKAIVFESDSDDRGIIQCPETVQFLESFGYNVKWLRRPEGDIFHRENYFARHTSL
jgi:FkbM family methyltransferase